MRRSGLRHQLPSLLWASCAGLGLSLLGWLPAAAHGTAQSDVLGGASHPLLGLDHLLLLVAVGCTSALAGAQLLWLAAAGAVAGGVLGSLGGSLPAAELLAALVIGVLGAVLLRHSKGQTGAALVGAALAVAVAVHAMLHGLESSGHPAWWLGAAISSILVVAISHLVLERLNPRLRQGLPTALMLGGSALAIAALI